MKRPIGITLISVVLLILTFFTVLLGLIIFISPGEKPISLIFIFITMTILQIAAGIGMLLGKKWSWWLSVFFFYSIFISIPTSIVTSSLPAEAYGADNLPRFFAVFVLCGFALYYFYTKKVLEFFLLNNLSKVKLIILPPIPFLALQLINAISYIIRNV